MPNTQEEYNISGDKLVSKIKEIVKEGNARKIIIKKEDGETLIEFPLTIGAVGVLAAPIIAAVGAFAALVSSCTIIVERKAKEEK
ncbi:hypothetical protein C0581_02280 [Candidatus Parcubacteria bacterium]|mgnify:CR=1 FL=1|nr:MAG: hypothetical protein C0581_02280 [Candidatus Parcubacteria bacterium]